jgi:hypothetical protein
MKVEFLLYTEVAELAGLDISKREYEYVQGYYNIEQTEAAWISGTGDITVRTKNDNEGYCLRYDEDVYKKLINYLGD